MCFHILCDTLTQDTKTKLKTLECHLNARYPCTIALHYVSQEDFRDLQPWGADGTNWCAYFRLKIGDVLSLDITRCVYLDVDILVLDDIRELCAYELGSKAVGMVRHIDSGSGPQAPQRMFEASIEHRDYCNSGVLVMDLAKWRSYDMTRIRDFPYMRFPDQDFINYTFRDCVCFVPLRWNLQWNPTAMRNLAHKHWDDGSSYTYAQCQEALKSPAIVHFIGMGLEPWKTLGRKLPDQEDFVHNPFRTLWWEVARRTPFYGRIRWGFARRAFVKIVGSYMRVYAKPLYHALKKIMT
ncbi:glycosyltransferase family 8 protein [uncultured Helicobacter sp.]|uniref:glycosyltransferase family 8 protein n=1 Tax=uncultured Helicobacter sp. TaxID=175537 RepID=UPI00374E4AD7